MEASSKTVALCDLEKENLSKAYHDWRVNRSSNKYKQIFYAPPNVNNDAVIRELRFIYNSSLRFLPLFLIWYIAEFFCTIGVFTRQPSLEKKGKDMLAAQRSFRPLK